MPSTTVPQAVLMAIACKHPEKSRANVSQKVACEFNRADKRSGILKGSRRKRAAERLAPRHA